MYQLAFHCLFLVLFLFLLPHLLAPRQNCIPRLLTLLCCILRLTEIFFEDAFRSTIFCFCHLLSSRLRQYNILRDLFFHRAGEFYSVFSIPCRTNLNIPFFSTLKILSHLIRRCAKEHRHSCAFVVKYTFSFSAFLSALCIETGYYTPEESGGSGGSGRGTDRLTV
jgi:hypothetical protein